MKLKTQPAIADSSQAETRRQLLLASAQVFAETGFRNATVREICRRAGANIAAINYHFGDKETLYLEVLRFAKDMALAKHPLLLDVSPNAAAEKRLHAFVLSFLLRIFDEGEAAWHGKLMSREMIEPSHALDSIVEERIRPMADQLGLIVAEILDRPTEDERVRQCAFSVVSQCLFYHHCGPVVARLFPDALPVETASIERLAEHITEFSLAAMKKFRQTKA